MGKKGGGLRVGNEGMVKGGEKGGGLRVGNEGMVKGGEKGGGLSWVGKRSER